MRLHEREIHGGSVKAGRQRSPVILCERDKDILITLAESTLVKIEVTPASARVMARNLQRLARRIEARAAAFEAQRAGTVEQAPLVSGATAESGDAQ